jgi:Tol biopolymer transport system component
LGGASGSSIPGSRADIWVVNLERSTNSRITFAPGNNAFPVWSPNGERIAFFSSRQTPGIYQVAANGVGKDELLLAGSGVPYPSDWSHDGRFIAFTQASPMTGNDVMILPLAGDRRPLVFANAPFTQHEAVFAPDGRWIAYTTVDAETGAQVFVQPFPATGGQYQISRNGGAQPTWRGDGRELFFLTPGGQMMAVAIDTRSGFEASNPVPLFEGIVYPGTGGRQYGVTKDGQRFLINVPQRSSPVTLTVVVNWRAAVP